MNLLFPINGQWLRWMLWLTIIAPLLEEFVLRAGLHNALLRHSVAASSCDAAPARWSAMGRAPVRLASLSCLFCLMHLARGAGLALAVVPSAMLIGWLYERTGNWRLCAATHAVMNLLWLTACAGGVTWLVL